MIKRTIKKIVNLVKSPKLVPIVQTVPDGELLKGKVALITGGSGGIGMAIAARFLAAGAKVIIAGTNDEKLARCCAQLGSEENVKSVKMDARNVSEYSSMVEKVLNLFPESRIDILVNSAGVVNKGGFFEISEEEYDRVMDINVKGVFFACQAVSRYMIDNKIKGHILNISSSSALRPAWTPYQMSKWSIRGFTQGLADTLLPYGIIVNAIGPGQTATGMLGMEDNESIYNGSNPCGRYATPEEIANLALFMVGQTGDLIIGETFYMTGGSGSISMHR
jgi:3-oxoacyl-[acyl-carrier protein] reductase